MKKKKKIPKNTYNGDYVWLSSIAAYSKYITLSFKIKNIIFRGSYL